MLVNYVLVLNSSQFSIDYFCRKIIPMRYIKDIPNKQFKISIYQWNNKYIINIEAGMFEQTYKIEEYDITNVEEIEKSMDAAFLLKVLQRFEAMHEDFAETLRRNDVVF